jgi:hypothetical protein
MTTSKPGLPTHRQVQIPTYWTDQQALAVFEVIDDIREQVWAIYGPNLQREIQNQRHASSNAAQSRNPRSDL